jgi:hypothetical protein
MDWEDDREVDSDIVTWFKEKLHKLDNYEDFMWNEKDHMPMLADFVFSFGSKTLYCYMTKDGQWTMIATYQITRIPKCAQILYFVRDQGFITPESLAYMVSIGSVRNTSGESLARSMSDLQMMVKRRQVTKPQVAASGSFQRPKPPPMKKNALMPSLSDHRLPSRVGTRISTPEPLFTDTVRSTMRLMTPQPNKPQTPEGLPMNPMLRMVAAAKAAKAMAAKRRPQTRG